MSSKDSENQMQLSMDFSQTTESPNSIVESPDNRYEALDHQLADLMQQLSGDKQQSGQNQTLKHCTREISQHTREGQIAIECTPAQQTELLKTSIVGKAGDYKPLILDKGYLYLRRYWQYQQQLANQIKSRLEPIEINNEFESWAQQRLDYYFGKATTSESETNSETDWQKVAAECALKNQFIIVSGGPGTGKTTTITRILALLIEAHINGYYPCFNDRLLRLASQDSADFVAPRVRHKATPLVLGKPEQKLKILLAAPTGKASIRMLDAINEAQAKLKAPDDVLAQMPKQANTIHKLLGYIPEKVSFKHNRHKPLNADVVLVDEASMIDIALMAKLVEAVPPQAKLILIGDKDQLSSVETGSVFADMCEGLSTSDENSLSPEGRGGRKNNNLITLQKNWRFAKDSSIGQLAIAANQGDSQTLLTILKDETKPDGTLIAPSVLASNQIPSELIAPWQNYFDILNNPKSSNPDASTSEIFEAFNQYRILCALRRGLNGSTILSNRIETTLAKQGLIKTKNAQNWYHGRPIMITQNSYSKGLFNGDTGIALMDKNGDIKVYFPDGEAQGAFKAIAPVRLPAHETTWAMTIHKSQGSEFKQVALILPHEVMPLLTKQLIYTGITRAKEQLSIVASEAVLNAGINTEVLRATRIGEQLL